MIGEVLEKQSIDSLINIAKELNLSFIPLDAEIRTIAGEIFSVDSEETTYMQFLSIAPVLSMILAENLEKLIKK